MEKTIEAKSEPIVAQQEKAIAPQTNIAEVDYEKLLADKEAEIKQTRIEKENYRKGMLKANGKLPDDVDDAPSKNWREEARQIAREEFLVTQEGKLQAEKDSLINEALRQNKELQTALKNRGQMGSGTASGSNQDRFESKVDTVLSNDQLNALRAKGWDEKKIEAFKKNLTAPMTGAK